MMAQLNMYGVLKFIVACVLFLSASDGFSQHGGGLEAEAAIQRLVEDTVSQLDPGMVDQTMSYLGTLSRCKAAIDAVNANVNRLTWGGIAGILALGGGLVWLSLDPKQNTNSIKSTKYEIHREDKSKKGVKEVLKVELDADALESEGSRRTAGLRKGAVNRILPNYPAPALAVITGLFIFRETSKQPRIKHEALDTWINDPETSAETFVANLLLSTLLPQDSTEDGQEEGYSRDEAKRNAYLKMMLSKMTLVPDSSEIVKKSRVPNGYTRVIDSIEIGVHALRQAHTTYNAFFADLIHEHHCGNP